MDCAKSCPVGVPPIDDELYPTIGVMNQTTVIIGTVFGALGVVSVLIGKFFFNANLIKGRSSFVVRFFLICFTHVFKNH